MRALAKRQGEGLTMFLIWLAITAIAIQYTFSASDVCAYDIIFGGKICLYIFADVGLRSWKNEVN
ncbi:hypothetical protein BX661DRAFT_176759 [Kickxella alabastrina]|uniref:uncharacterized protein n=1 Tax=Kickxella alabastrina TaxID=61397 RepID=UPI00221EA987|nr:uncharacterized protein BX661DRAFT_176759 [Kickxella alabastrina]KAI7834182.1 hypothetical protein BX661DRAFT_176759 [Kickxella alabastrina]